jgi:hypothetical protein
MSLNEITMKEEKSDDLNVIVKTSFYDESLNVKQEIKTEQEDESFKVKLEQTVDRNMILTQPPPRSDESTLQEPSKSTKDNPFENPIATHDIKKEDAKSKVRCWCNECKIGFATIKELLIHQKLHAGSLVVSNLKSFKVD